MGLKTDNYTIRLKNNKNTPDKTSPEAFSGGGLGAILYILGMKTNICINSIHNVQIFLRHKWIQHKIEQNCAENFCFPFHQNTSII